MGEGAPADAAAEAVLVPGELAHAHQVAVLDLLAASLADLHDLFALDARAQFCEREAKVSSMWTVFCVVASAICG